jgi:SSS family solute:Na+ symporter/sodium/pantothenate symporter
MTELASPGYGVLAALLVFITASVWLGTVAQRRIERSSYLEGYFLGNRSLGAWALALTATVQSGGTFMGFPSLVYSHGWIVALWIAGYMVVPLTGFAVVGKRMAQISRRTGAITVPDLVRERFASPAAGLIASLLIIVFMSSMMVAQFKAGAIVMKLAWPGNSGMLSGESVGGIDRAYLVGLVVFAVTVVFYTLIGGFLASVWTDLFQSVMMLLGVLILLVLIVPAAGGLEQATRTAVAAKGPEFAFGPGYGTSGHDFLTPGLAVSFFFIWCFAGFSSPASVTRVMASESTDVIRKSIILLASYNFLIYIPLIAICIAGRALLPDLAKPDEVIPRLALASTADLPGGTVISGLILAAPFGAVMATVSCYLLVIASGLVRDIYLRFLRPHAGVREIRLLTAAVMILVGLLAIAANIRPVKYLQALVVFSGASGAATFAVPALMTAYWRRGTAKGAVAAMLAGAGTMFSLFALGWVQRLAQNAVADGDASALWQTLAGWLGPDPLIGIAGPFRPYFVMGLDPVLWALAASAIAGVTVSLCTAPPPPQHIERMFGPTPAAGEPRPD